MKCEEFALLLDRPMEELSDAEKKEMDRHAAQCEECALMRQVIADMRDMDAQEEVPEAFSSGWRALVAKEEQKEMDKKIIRFDWKRALSAAAAVVFVAGGTLISYVNGWGLEQKAENQTQMVRSYTTSYSDSTNGAMLMKSTAYDAGAAPQSASAQESKIIRTVDFTLKTQHYDADYEKLQQKASEFGGRVESLNVYSEEGAGNLRRANLTLRVPAGQLDAFVESLDGVGTMASYSEYTEDVSANYYDVQARLDTQLTKMARLQELMAKAETTADLIELENAISDTQYMIDSYTGQLKGYDSRINDSYVYVTLREVSSADAAEEKSLPIGERIVNALKASGEFASDLAQSLAVFAVVALPWCAALAAVVLLAKLVRRWIRKK